MGKQKREHFRILYPLDGAAKLELRKGTYPIHDLSQRGLKYGYQVKSDALEWRVGQLFKGHLYFLCGEKLPLEGSILRIEDDCVVLQLHEPIPLKLMYDEHRFIIQKFGKSIPKAES